MPSEFLPQRDVHLKRGGKKKQHPKTATPSDPPTSAHDVFISGGMQTRKNGLNAPDGKRLCVRECGQAQAKRTQHTKQKQNEQSLLGSSGLAVDRLEYPGPFWNRFLNACNDRSVKMNATTALQASC